MAFIKENQYQLTAYLTEKGKEKFYQNGLRQAIDYFSLGSEDVDFRDNPYNYNQFTTNLRGNIINGQTTKQNLEIKKNKIENKIAKYSDLDFSQSLNLETFTVDTTNNNKKSFGNELFGFFQTPVKIGDVKVNENNPNDSPENSFFILNKSSNTLYLEDITFESVFPASHFLFDKTILEEHNKIQFKIGWYLNSNTFFADRDAYEEGIFSLELQEPIFNTNRALFPFEIFHVKAKYEVLTPGLPRFHYHGQTINNDKDKGELNFRIRINALDKQNRIEPFQEITKEVGLIVTVKNSGSNTVSSIPNKIFT